MPSKPQGIALCVGLNAVDPNHYQGWDGALNACEADAIDMATLAKARGLQAKTLLTGAASSQAIALEVLKAANQLQAGDLFMLSYSGHGAQLPDRSGDEKDGLDETWCCFDRQLLDDEINRLLLAFKSGVRVLLLSDSCHSGTVSKTMPRHVGYRQVPHEIQRKTFDAHAAMYRSLKGAPERAPAASVILLSGCQDHQLSADGEVNGLFTATLLKLYQKGAFKGSYASLIRGMSQLMPRYQRPNYSLSGPVDPRFVRQAVFSL